MNITRQDQIVKMGQGILIAKSLYYLEHKDSVVLFNVIIPI